MTSSFHGWNGLIIQDSVQSGPATALYYQAHFGKILF